MVVTNVVTAQTFSGISNRTFLVAADTNIAPGLAIEPLRFDTSSDNNLITVLGTLHAGAATAFHVDASALDTVRVGDTGKIISDPSYAAVLDGDVNSLHSAGLIKGNIGVYVDNGGGSLVENSGRIVSTGMDAAGVIFGSGVDAGTLRNSGVIRADPGSDSFGAYIDGAGARVENDGLIRGGLAALRLVAGASSLINHGKIVGTQNGLGLGDDEQVQNYGLIEARDDAGFAILSDSTHPSTIVNHGRIVGMVSLGDGADLFENDGKGRVAGMSDLGAGDDTYFGGRHADKVHGGDDGDELLGGKGRDKLHGDAGGDLIDGGKGDDRLTGGMGADTFAFSGHRPGDDKVMDWAAGDRVDLSAYGLSPSQQSHFIDHAQHHQNGHLVIDLGMVHGIHDGSLAFHGFNTELTAGDFVF